MGVLREGGMCLMINWCGGGRGGGRGGIDGR